MQSFRINLSSHPESYFDCDAKDTILRAALRSGEGFPYECNSGGCGSCQFELVEGELKELWQDAPGLGARARERGRRLACQCVPQTDCTIKVRLNDDAAPPIAPRRQELTLVGTRALTQDMSEFSFRSKGGALFLAGQFAMLSLPGVEGARAYSMSNISNAGGEWKFVVKRVAGGQGTAVLFDTLKSGDKVLLDAPYGNSFLRTDSGRDIVCVAGGSGLSPVMSILQAAVDSPELSNRQISLFYGGRGPADICVDELFAAHPKLRERVSVYVAISDEEAPGANQWDGERGFVHELVGRVLGEDIPGYDFYFCGPPPMTDALHRMLLLEYKVPGAQLYFDRFF